MLRPLALLALLLVLALAACGDDDGGSPTASPSSTVAPTASPLNAGEAVYISLGDATQEGWGEDFAAYLSQRLNRDVARRPIGGNTTTELIAGVGGLKPSALDMAVQAIDDYEARGSVVVAVTFSTGSSDISALARTCTDCAAEADALAKRYREQLGVIYSRLIQALDGPAPILQATVFDAGDCVENGEATIIDADPLNETISEIAADNDAFVVEVPWSAGLCDPEGGLPKEARDGILEAHQAVYDSLPSARIEPFVVP